MPSPERPDSPLHCAAAVSSWLRSRTIHDGCRDGLILACPIATCGVHFGRSMHSICRKDFESFIDCTQSNREKVAGATRRRHTRRICRGSRDCFPRRVSFMSFATAATSQYRFGVSGSPPPPISAYSPGIGRSRSLGRGRLSVCPCSRSVSRISSPTSTSSWPGCVRSSISRSCKVSTTPVGAPIGCCLFATERITLPGASRRAGSSAPVTGGLFVRYSGGEADLPALPRAKVGGLQVGAIVRYRF